MKLHVVIALTLAASFSTLTFAAETVEAALEVIAPGMQANAWLSAQRQGAIASSNLQAASGIQRDKAAERFMKTYDFPIKESFYGDNFKAGK